jgi:hypothetical protein
VGGVRTFGQRNGTGQIQEGEDPETRRAGVMAAWWSKTEFSHGQR